MLCDGHAMARVNATCPALLASSRPRSKACLNQLNIEAQLACLPIYLSGCSSLVVLAGATFTERIWCIAVKTRSLVCAAVLLM